MVREGHGYHPCPSFCGFFVEFWDGGDGPRDERRKLRVGAGWELLQVKSVGTDEHGHSRTDTDTSIKAFRQCQRCTSTVKLVWKRSFRPRIPKFQQDPLFCDLAAYRVRTIIKAPTSHDHSLATSMAGKLGFRILPSPPRLSDAIIARFRGMASANVADAMGRFNFMDPAIRARSGLALCGSAVTVLCRPADNLMVHKALD